MTGQPKQIARNGFTLIELLIAMTILSLLSYLSYKGVTSLLVAEKRLEEGGKRLQSLDRFLSEFERDIIYAAPRSVRIVSNQTEAALLGAPVGTQGSYRINLSRFATAPDTPPQRISYIFAAPAISLAATANMDFSLPADNLAVQLLDGVQSVALRFQNTDGRWSPVWPPAGNTDTLSMPVAVELVLVLNDLGTVTRLIARP